MLVGASLEDQVAGLLGDIFEKIKSFTEANLVVMLWRVTVKDLPICQW